VAGPAVIAAVAVATAVAPVGKLIETHGNAMLNRRRPRDTARWPAGLGFAEFGVMTGSFFTILAKL
jgi:hypothetical protein